MCMIASATSSLLAQDTTYEVQIATTTFVNKNLDADCSAEMIYLNLVQGNFDVDGDGLVPPESAFTIEIDDADPSNGNILDGCGSWNFTITATPGGGVVGFGGGSGIINASDVTAPTVIAVAEANGPFFSTELDDVTINTLPNTVDRTFVIDGSTGFPVMNTLDPALMMRLLTGGDIPRFTDACSDVEVTVSDLVSLDGDCGDIIITRTFVAQDFSENCNAEDEGNTSTSVSYDILLVRPDGGDVQCPPDVVNFECNDPGVTDGELPAPNESDFPFINTPDGPLFLTSPFGNVGVTFTDSAPITICSNTYKFIRTWTIIDWCDPENVQTCTQLVKVGDTGGPDLVLPSQDLDFDGLADDGPLVFSTNAPGCGAFVSTNPGGVVATDLCGEVASITAFVLLGGDEDNVVGPIDVLAANPVDRLTPFLPLGPHTIRYIARDDCGNETTEDLEIVIEDRTGPVVIAEDALNVSLSDAGFAVVLATDVDEGSYDDCTDVILEIAFANPSSMLPIGTFGPSITLTCIDIGVVPVILRVTDLNGNSNERMSILNVVDNSAPICIAPGPLAVDCVVADNLIPEDLNAEFAVDPTGVITLLTDLFGTPTSLDNCGNEVVDQTVVDDRNECGQGTITRSFTVTDARGFVSLPGCTQVITVRGVRDYTIEWPADVTVECGEMPVFEEVDADEFGCDLLVTTVETDTFFATSVECFRLRRTIEVFNFCEYNGIDEAYNVPRDADGDGNFEEPTFLHVIPNSNTFFTDDEAILDRDNDRTNNNSIGALDEDDNIPGNIDSDSDGDTGYANSLNRGYFRYVQFVSVIDNTPPVVEQVSTTIFDDVNCTGGDVTVNYLVADDCVMNTVSTTAFLDINYDVSIGFSPDRAIQASELTSDGMGGFTINLTEVPTGTHAIRANGMDGCGNWDAEIITFTVEDATGIAPICIERLVFELSPDGQGGGIAVLDAESFVVDVNGNCNDEEVSYSIYREFGEADQPGFVPAPGRTEFLVSCDDSGVLAVRVYVFGESGQFDFCSTTADIEEINNNVCIDPFTGTLAGFVTTPLDELMSDVEVHITDMGEMNDMQYTDQNGSFIFGGLEEGNTYRVRPAMGDMVNLQRVKTSDINRIMNHIMGTNPLDNPHLMIAADVDADGFITVGDMVSIRRAILGLDDTFTNGPTFRFIRRDFDLTGLTEGWDPDFLPTTYTVDPLEGDNREADFVAIEIGDVYIDLSGREQRELLTQDEHLAAGENFEVTLTAGELAGFQGTIEAATGLSITGWTSSLLGAANVNDRLLGDGLLALSYNDQLSLEGQEIITLQVVALEELRISDYLSVTSRIAHAEGITAEGASSDLALNFRETTGGAGIMLHQNFPNPVAAQTTIVFELPTAATAQLEIHDLQGRLLSTRTIDGYAGRNTVVLDSNDDLNNITGLLTYTLVVGKQRLTKRMTVVSR